MEGVEIRRFFFIAGLVFLIYSIFEGSGYSDMSKGVSVYSFLCAAAMFLSAHRLKNKNASMSKYMDRIILLISLIAMSFACYYLLNTVANNIGSDMFKSGIYIFLAVFAIAVNIHIIKALKKQE